ARLRGEVEPEEAQRVVAVARVVEVALVLGSVGAAHLAGEAEVTPEEADGLARQAGGGDEQQPQDEGTGSQPDRRGEPHEIWHGGDAEYNRRDAGAILRPLGGEREQEHLG